jgi:rhodanese-related sulfurtransferase
MYDYFFASMLSLGSIFGSPGALELTEPSEAYALIKRGEAVVVDAREREELITGLAEPAIWIPTSELRKNGDNFRAFVEQLEPETTVLVYCATGRRAQAFVDRLRSLGFEAKNLGSFNDWKDAGLPIKHYATAAHYTSMPLSY